MAQKFTPKQFRAAFRTEKQCRDHLFRLKYPDGYRCKRCSYELHHEIAHRDAWQCAGCHYQESAKAGTIFHKSRIKLTDWFQAIYEITISKGGISALELQARLGFGSYKTAWGLMHKLRRAMQLREHDGGRVGGMIELDATMFGRRKTGNQATAYFAVEVTSNSEGKECAGRLKASQVTKQRRDDAFWFAEENVADGTIVRTDAAPELVLLGRHLDIEIQPLNMSRDASLNGVWLKWVHRVIGNIKGALHGVHHGVSAKYLDAYLAEHCYRFNRRGNRQTLQSRLLQACVAAPPTTLTDIAA